MRTLHHEFKKDTLLKGRKLLADVKAVGRYAAPPGHNRDTDVYVEFHLTPANEALSDIPHAQEGLQSLFDEAIAGLCEVLFESEFNAVTGFKIISLKIGPEPLNALLPISCRRAGRLAAASVLRDCG